MAENETDRVIGILGGAAVLEQVSKASKETKGQPPRSAKGRVAAKTTVVAHEIPEQPTSRNVYAYQLDRFFKAPDDRTKWTALIRARLPSTAFEKAAESLGL